MFLLNMLTFSALGSHTLLLPVRMHIATHIACGVRPSFSSCKHVIERLVHGNVSTKHLYVRTACWAHVLCHHQADKLSLLSSTFQSYTMIMLSASSQMCVQSI